MNTKLMKLSKKTNSTQHNRFIKTCLDVQGLKKIEGHILLVIFN